MVHLSALTNLETLSMAYSLAGDPSMATVAELTQLQHLDLDSCPITNACVVFSSPKKEAGHMLYHLKHHCVTFGLHLPLIRFIWLPPSCLLHDVRHQVLSDVGCQCGRGEAAEVSAAELLCLNFFRNVDTFKHPRHPPCPATLSWGERLMEPL